MSEIIENTTVDQTNLEHAVMQLICDKDFDGYLITRFDARIVKTLPGQAQTACLMYVDGRFFIRAAEEFFDGLTEKERVAVLKHEMAHFVNKHFARRNGRDPYLWNLANDCAINQGIDNLPENCIICPDDWTANEASEYYYNKYLKLAEKQQEQQGQSGQPGSGDGKLPNLFDEVYDAPLNAGPEADSMADEIIRETVKERLDAGMSLDKLRGLYAGGLQDYINDLTSPPITDWRHVLSRFASTLADSQSSITLKRPDRRNLSPFGRRKEYLPSLCICIDSSGSVSDSMLSKFFSQVALLGMQLSEIEVVIADAKVHEHFTYRKGLETKLKQSAFGRGGTDFDPAVKYINKNLTHCDGVVYLTDGYCPVPSTKCTLPLIWLVTDAENFQGKPKVMCPLGKD